MWLIVSGELFLILTQPKHFPTLFLWQFWYPFSHFFTLKSGQLRGSRWLEFALLCNCFLIFSLRSKFGLKRISSLFQYVFQKEKWNSSLHKTLSSKFRSWNTPKKQKKALQIMILIIFWNFFIFFQFFILPQGKQCAIITYKINTCQLPHELPNQLNLRISGN